MRTLLAALLTAAALGGLAVADAGEGAPDALHPAIVAGHRLPAPVGDRDVEVAWLAGEARERGLAADGGLARLRRVVAAAVGADARSGGQLVAAFDAFHRRWRARTHCLASAHDAYTDRCADRTAAPAGACHWMGAAWLCELRAAGAWLVVSPGGRESRLRSRDRAAAAVFRIYRRTVERAVAAERSAAGAAAGARRARLAVERRLRAAEPELGEATLAAAAPVCRAYGRAIGPFLFGGGLQDPGGQAEGLRSARRAILRRLPGAAADAADARRLRPLIGALRSGERALTAIVAAAEAGDIERASHRYERFEAGARRESRLAERLGLGEWLDLG